MTEDHQDNLVTAGWALVRAGNYRGAVSQFHSALAMDPDYTPALIGLAQTQLHMGNIKEAEQTTGAMLRLAPNDAVSHRFRAEVLRQKRRYAEAAKVGRHAIALDPKDPYSYHILALCYSAQKQYRTAIRVCEEGLAQSPNAAVLMAQAAENLMETRGVVAALAYSNEAVRLNPDSPTATRVAARIALARRDLPRAREITSGILRRNASDEDALSLFLLTDPNRHSYLRNSFIFRYWRKDHPWAGWTLTITGWTVFLAVLIALTFITRAAAVIVVVIIRLFNKSQYDAHRKEVREHFKQVSLGPRF